jgi:hypothetical protein
MTSSFSLNAVVRVTLANAPCVLQAASGAQLGAVPPLPEPAVAGRLGAWLLGARGCVSVELFFAPGIVTCYGVVFVAGGVLAFV